MTVSGQRGALPTENVAAPQPTHGQRAASRTTNQPPLPDGWAAFRSRPDATNAQRWYATPPYSVVALKEQFGTRAADLEYTVSAETWPALRRVVATQAALYLSLTEGA